MTQDKFGQMIFSQSDVCDLIMQGRSMETFDGMLVDETVNIESAVEFVDHFPDFVEYWKFNDQEDVLVPDWDTIQQETWHMPQEYQQLDIAEHVLSLCATDAELQRCGSELLLYQERNLFNLLRYLKYLVDVMQQNHVIWGVGRGSSVASHVLYKLGVHRVDSLFYDLDVSEFLR
jgi:DNA polymerase III alpha subunit